MTPPGTSPLAPVWRRFHWVGFLAIHAFVCFLLFRPVIMGDSIFSPLDIAPNLFSKYRYLDPNATGVPANHYVVDMILGDLPRNVLVYEAWQRGEWPWWDPYTDGGKPLAAEANAVNVSDPFKVLLFHVLPFEAAYNWVRIIPFILSGLFAYLLLRHFRFSFAVSMWGGLLYSFAGCNFLMFSGPTVQAGFAYYPLLWLLWDKALHGNRFMWFGVSAFVSALIFLSGNLQSHSYPFLFACAFLVGYGWKHQERWVRLVGGMGVSLVGGLCLAAPFVLSQIELFMRSVRLFHPFKPAGMLSGVVSLATGFFPWLLGTFRTMDFSKFVGQSGLGFWVYIGSIALVIVVLGAIVRWPAHARENDWKRTSLSLIVIYLIVCSTPLIVLFYTRTASLAVLGFAVLFAFGWKRLVNAGEPFKRYAAFVIALSVLAAATLNVTGFWIYPRVQDKVEARILGTSTPSLGRAEALRRFQVVNLPNEITFRNKEVLVAFVGLAALSVFLWRLPRRREQALHGLLVLNILPLLWFGGRYIPMQPLSMWQRLREGGPEQRRVADTLRTQGLRLVEEAPDMHDLVFPGALSQLFKVHVLHGHSSLMIQSANRLGIANPGTNAPGYGDYIYRSSALEAGGELIPQPGNPRGHARLRWAEDTPRAVRITAESLTRMELAISPGPAGDLIRTDSYYPGWRVEGGNGARMTFEPPCFFRIHVPAETHRLALVYEPRWLRPGLWIAGSAAVILGMLMAVLAARGSKQ